MYRYESILRQYEATMSFVRLFITDIHLHQNYIHSKHSEECLRRLVYLEEQMIDFIDAFQHICLKFFTADIGPEWLQTYFMGKFKEVQHLINFIEHSLKTQTSWPQRPLLNDVAPIVVKRRNSTITNLL